MQCNSSECKTNALKLVNLVSTVANLQAETAQKAKVISVLINRLERYWQRYGELPEDRELETYAAPSVLLDKPAAGIKTHVSTEHEEIPPCPGILLGAPLAK